MAGPTDLEQLELELINETRLDPLGAARRYITSYSPLISSDPQIQSAVNFFGVNGAALLAAYSALTPVGALAWNDALASAAEKHSALMISLDSQQHQLPGELGLGPRAQAEGYNYSFLGENIYAYANSMLYGQAGFMIDWGSGPDGMQSPAGHRTNLMNAGFTEIGVDVTPESNPSTVVGPYVITEDIGNRGKLFVLGVAYSDTDANHFYSVGEGRADLTMQIGAGVASSTASGGYALETTSGAKTITLTGGGLSGAVSVQAAIGTENLKLDVVDGATLLTSGSVAVSGAISELHGLGVRGLTLTAGAGSQTLIGGSGNDTLDGGSGVDKAVFSAAMSAYTITSNGASVTVSGAEGADTLSNIELLQFSDQTFHFRAGIGASVDFTASPSTYAGALRDFDGNDLGGSGAWVLAGHVDIQGDGDQEYILFNRQIGRWATIGPATDGKVYFDDHGWGGDTRVVGIYIDPEVQLGHAALGGPDDSQRRFQNDLNIGNLKGILGARDYNHDGLQEVYFSLTDGTAYLHAYMHADGNIQYANYQSQQQVIDYLTANGAVSSTWDGWFL
ncbi:MAG: hypothetical protein JWM33_2059 [Caulobacteraceae bacterium]|nr:hypothetical protein [Caulobacteraceae bacterium]